MGDVIDPSRVSIDGLIDWLREKRVRQPGAKLAELLASHQFDQSRLVDLACIDLIQRRRMGHTVSVETYLDEFPDLSADSTRLDLIDAELCVANELGVAVDVEQYVKRFPDLAAPIRELVQLEGVTPAAMASALIGLGDSRRASEDSTTGSAEFSIEPTTEFADGRLEIAFPVDVPPWFVAEKSVACSPGRWLIQGRDADRGTKLALKVVELPSHVTAAQQEEVLDACEAAAKVRNRAWIAPRVAAIQSRRLAVVRPWIFARPWQQCESRGRRVELRDLASVAFAVQAAHEAGATHGGIQFENLLVNHAGQIQVVDAICNLHGLSHWLRCGEGIAAPRSVAARIDLDTQSLIKLIVVASVDWAGDRSNEVARPASDRSEQITADVRGIAEKYPSEACGRIGELLIRQSDGESRSAAEKTADRFPWRKRLRQWFSASD